MGKNLKAYYPLAIVISLNSAFVISQQLPSANPQGSSDEERVNDMHRDLS
ncbi:MAG: hypothetical protein ACI9JM_003475 [Halioglobus sp.]|jgi:hypothetical protein